jgi:predicted NBD/HSP70 family sugar kinase
VPGTGDVQQCDAERVRDEVMDLAGDPLPLGQGRALSLTRAGDPLGREVVQEEARRIALHIAPIAAVTDVALVVLGGGIGANGDLLLDPIRGLLAEWLPFPPRIEVSGIGDAAVLMGALAVGLGLARERVFANRGAPADEATVG